MVTNYDSYFTEFNQIIQEQLEENITLYYPEARENCPNCYLDTFGAVARSVSIYKAGGPIPFSNGMPCPYCDGLGYKAIEVTEEIPGRSYITNKNFISAGGLNIPQGSHQFICKYTYYPKLVIAKFMVPRTELHDYVNQRYYLVGQPDISGFKMNPVMYMTSYWAKQVG